MKLAKPRVVCARRGTFFPVRALPDKIVSSSSVMGFKAGVSNYTFVVIVLVNLV